LEIKVYPSSTDQKRAPRQLQELLLRLNYYPTFYTSTDKLGIAGTEIDVGSTCNKFAAKP